MLKKIFYPFQKALLDKRLCVGCTHPLDKARIHGELTPTKIFLECKCKRRYVLDKETNTFKRATFDEEKLFFIAKKQ